MFKTNREIIKDKIKELENYVDETIENIRKERRYPKNVETMKQWIADCEKDIAYLKSIEEPEDLTQQEIDEIEWM